jgi:GAF domain-containing protein
VLQEKRPIAVLDVTREPGFTYQDLARREGLASLLSVPMMIKDRVIGVVNSYTSELHRFTEEEIKVLQAVANQAAIAIENTTLLERSHAMEQELESRKVVERAKGLLMKSRRISEEEAFALLRKQSMNTRRSMREIAEAVILAMEMGR